MSISDYWLGSDNAILISKKDSMAYLNHQVPINPFRGQFQYNNLGYKLAGHVIEKLSGSTWTSLRIPGNDIENVASTYVTLDDATPFPVAPVQAQDDTLAGPTAALKTNMKDLLSLYTVLIKSINDQFAHGTTSTPGSPFKQVKALVSAQNPMDQAMIGESLYAMGWARRQLPGPLGGTGFNPSITPDGMPIVGKGAPSQLALYHQGSLPGSLAAVTLLPETKSVVVVMTNSLALNDWSDWVNQPVLEELLNVPHRNDYVQASKTSAANTLTWCPTVSEKLNKEQNQNTSAK